MELLNTFGLPLLAVIIIIFLTQQLKKNIYVLFADKWKKIFSYFTPLVMSLIIYALIMIPDFTIDKYTLYVGGTWAFSALGFDGINAMLLGKKKDKNE